MANEIRSSNTGLVVLITILIILVLSMGGYIAYNEFFGKEGNKNTNTNTNINNNDENDNITILGHTLSGRVGSLIIDKDGSVYYEPSPVMSLFEKHNPIFSDDSVLGTKGTWTTEVYQTSDICEEGDNSCYSFDGYKLDLTNIRSAYELILGNGDGVINIIFISRDGYIHELVFEQMDATKPIDLTLYKNVREYKNIVSIVPDSSNGAQSAIAIDVDGNEYRYYSAK